MQFEDIFLACLPTALFLVLSPFRIILLLQKPAAFSLRSKLLASKLVVLTGLLTVQLVFLALRARSQLFDTRASVAADALSFIATGMALVLSLLDHQRSLRPSTLLSLYLSASAILSIARTRTLWLLASTGLVPTMMTIAFVLTVMALLLESIETKTSLVADEKLDKKSHAPESWSGFWNRTCFTWLAATFWLGYSKIISVKDLPALDAKLKSHVLREKLISTWDIYDHKKRHSLLRACFRSYLLSSLSPIIPRLCLTAFTFSQPFLINTTVSFVGQMDPDSNYGKGLIGAWALVYLGIAASNSIYQYQNFRFTTRLRGGLIALVYRQTIQTRAVDMGEITAITLMGTDVERIVHGMQLFHEVWGSLLDIAIASWLLGQQLFLACLAPIILVIVFIGATSKISLWSKTAQLRWIEKVQERLRVTTTLLGDMKAVKMLGLTQVVSIIIQRLRVDEINTSRSFRKLLVVTLLLSLTPINLAPVITFAIYVIISVFWEHKTLLTAQAFTSIALISLLTTPVVVFIQTLPTVIQCVASFDRIQEYCNYGAGSQTNDDDINAVETQPRPEATLKPRASGSGPDTAQLSDKPAISFEGESFGWDSENHAVVLKDLKVEIQRGGVTAIVGPVGSGKSAFLNGLLGEMISMSTRSEKAPERKWRTEPIAYCSQQPWLENGTIFQNIVGISPYDGKWYENVKLATGLDSDVKQLRNGDNTRVGSKGLNLSGGQKQRIALARAVYSRRRIILLDDVFSGMDAHTADIVSSRLLGRDGLLRKLHATVVIATHSHKIMLLADMIIALENGKIIENANTMTLLQRNGYVSKLGLKPSSTEDIVKETTDAKDPQLSHEASQKSADIAEEIDDIPTDIRRKNGDMSVYKYYLKNAGTLAVGIYVISLIIWTFCTEFSTVWIMWWSDANTVQPNENVWMYMSIYAMLGVVGTIGVALAAWFAFISIISHTATNLHFDLLKTILKASFHFFATTDNGEILNRFSQDMELIDMDLPSTMVNYTSTMVSVVARLIILAVYSQYLGAALPFIGTVLYFLQRFYLQTSRQVRLLGIEARAPLYTHFTESVAGAVTIRAFGWQMNYQDRNYRHIDTSQRPTYLQNCIQSWLAFVLNMMTAALAVILVTTVVTWHDHFTPGGVGVSLVMVVGFSEILARLVQSWTKLESSIGAVARVNRFTAETESEETIVGRSDVPQEWPQAGGLEFAGVVSSYGPDTDPVLKSVSMSIRPRQHIAICGRSGSGKTSAILSLLRMIEVKEGIITVDGVDISTVPPAELRSRINVVPQDPFLMPGTIRFNVDPLATVPDEEIIHALRRVRLWTFIQDQGGLDKVIDTSTWSAGQKQLFCLARAMVKKSNILVLDEAMSSVDSETESVMQEIIDSEFRDCTVIAVMHRLRHVTRYDRVVLLDDGAVLEYGEPGALMAGDTRFAELHRLQAS